MPVVPKTVEAGPITVPTDTEEKASTEDAGDMGGNFPILPFLEGQSPLEANK
jgi:hypothetical protein